ncbi:MAG: magnesium/cobalt transporter CorA [Paludibacteraceae bacterium]|nr:magnesium/cobalt transporter CorA [Paludibacteraceae bacterium]
MEENKEVQQPQQQVRLFYFENGRLKIARDIAILKEVPLNNFVWIDLNHVAPETESQLEQFLKIYIQEEEEMEEIEMSSRFIETDDTLVANANFLLDTYEKETVSFILKNGIMVSVRENDYLKSFNDTVKKLFANPRNYPTGYHIFVALLETRVEYDADMIEDATKAITGLSQNLTTAKKVDENVLLDIKNMQERVMHLRENIVDKHRVLSSILRSDLVPEDLKPRLSMVIKDVNSLVEHIKFGFDRLDYLQDTFLGLVNIEQNKIIKIFTIISIVFMPPTLIASMYGMNFDYMPELHWRLGYPFALFMMLLVAVGVVVWFKKKNWL